MYWDVVSVEALPDWTIDVCFRDGTSGTVRFSEDYFSGVFERLKDPAEFAKVHIETGAVAWPGGLDLAPDAMYRQLKAHGEWLLSGTAEPVG